MLVIIEYLFFNCQRSVKDQSGASKKDPLITDSDLFADIDNWRLFLLEKEEDFDTVRKKTRTGRPCGDESFLAKTEKITKRLLLPKKAGRPKKEN